MRFFARATATCSCATFFRSAIAISLVVTLLFISIDTDGGAPIHCRAADPPPRVSPDGAGPGQRETTATSSQPSTQYKMGLSERVRWHESACMQLGEALILFVTMLALAALPSASVALVIARSATAGARHGIAVALGIVLGDLIYVATALFGLVALADSLGGLFLLIKLLGALYLIWLGSTMLFSRVLPFGVSATSATPSGLLGSVVAGLLLTLGDLKAILFYASLFPLFVDLDQLRIVDVLLIIVITTLSVGGVKLLYVLAARKLAARARCARMGMVAQRGAGALLLGAGSYLIATAPR